MAVPDKRSGFQRVSVAQDRFGRRGEAAVGFVEDEAGGQCGGAAGAPAGGDKDALGGPPGFRPEGDQRDGAEPAMEQGYQVVQTVGAVDQRQSAAWLQHPGAEGDPGGKVGGAFAMGQRAARSRRRGVRAGLLEGRVGHHAVEAGGGQAGGWRQEVAGQDAYAVFQVVVADVGGGKLRQIGLEFQAGDLRAWDAEGEAEGCRSDSGPDIEDALARQGRRGCGQQDRVDGGAVAVARLFQADAAVQQAVFGPWGSSADGGFQDRGRWPASTRIRRAAA